MTDPNLQPIEAENVPSVEEEFLHSEKGPNAFRTISEVADELHVPQHVLRFWETRFEQVRPLKRGGGRRYYRPSDIDLLKYIADFLYQKGYTVKGVQRLLREAEQPVVSVEPEMPDATAEHPISSGASDDLSVAEVVDGGRIAQPENDIAEEASLSAWDVTDSQAEQSDSAVSEDTLVHAGAHYVEGTTTEHTLEHYGEGAVVTDTLPVAEQDDTSSSSEDSLPVFSEATVESLQSEEDTSAKEAQAEPHTVSSSVNETEAVEVAELKQANQRLREDLEDILVELQSLRQRLSA
ncbi:MerR family transcriptional regulator [Acetobacter cibinongensis]|uniref:MerR family transcriptional regulator n=1 Tax=Acetobacter cibinongensis TaxID=146475 RepID=UPI001F0A342C|nr:MerR family transcriptional regulator [Acetobacter cibinongensis]